MSHWKIKKGMKSVDTVMTFTKMYRGVKKRDVKKTVECLLFQRRLPFYQGGVSISKKYLLLRGHLFR